MKLVLLNIIYQNSPAMTPRGTILSNRDLPKPSLLTFIKRLSTALVAKTVISSVFRSSFALL